MTATNPTAAALEACGLSHRYDIGKELGRGATATVFQAYDNFAKRDVAIKIAHPDIFGDEASGSALRKSWLNEVHLAGSLSHPYIVSVFDAGIGPGTAYLVMELLPHGTLDQFTRPDTLKPIAEVLEIAYKCASGLDYACKAGIIHRDVKPANLQYVGPGEAKVADFGAAYWTREDATQVMDIGSLAYMAPELFRQWVTPQADIYALGVALFRLLTADYPFRAETQAALMYQIMEGEPLKPSALRPNLPPDIDLLMAKFLARDLDQRYSNWDSVLRTLSHVSSKLYAPKPVTAPAGAGATKAAEPVAKRPSQSQMFDRLRQLPLLAELKDPQLWEMLRISRWVTVPKGTLLIAEGRQARSCYLLLEGEAVVSAEGNEIGRMSSGTFFGELAFAEATPSRRAATVTADSEVTVGKLPYERLRECSPQLQSGLLQVFFRLAAERLKMADKQFLEATQKRRPGAFWKLWS